ncbi:hypothetical protein CDV26_03380 [Francisella halioticida]|uniref:Integral membrane bound transporter domain-containing protein n=2 Tax=Francisella halioticida TaxID=549298 RepID=A0ABN5AZB6_9GAMM|nr:hypothetical protein CDV26_03380 [Francisella halioticida]
MSSFMVTTVILLSISGANISIKKLIHRILGTIVGVIVGGLIIYMNINYIFIYLLIFFIVANVGFFLCLQVIIL